MRRALSIAILILLSFILQTVFFSYDNLMGNAPDLMLILTMSFGIMRGRKEGMLTGFLAGLLMDIFYDTILGPYILLYMFTGYINGFFHRNFIMEDVMMPVGIVFLDSLSFHFIIFICIFLLRNRLDLPYYFIHEIMPAVVYTMLLTVVIYRILLHINRYLKKKALKK